MGLYKPTNDCTFSLKINKQNKLELVPLKKSNKFFRPPNSEKVENIAANVKKGDSYPLLRKIFKKQRFNEYLKKIALNHSLSEKFFISTYLKDKSLFHKDYNSLACFNFFSSRYMKNFRFTRGLTGEDLLNIGDKTVKTKNLFIFLKKEYPIPMLPSVSILKDFSNNIEPSVKEERDKDKILKYYRKYLSILDEKDFKEKNLLKQNVLHKIYYSAFDIECVNLELNSAEANDFLGGISISDEIYNNANNIPNSGEEKNITIQLPVLIGYTRFISYDKRNTFKNEDDTLKTKIFEISSLEGSNESIITNSLKMMSDFWLSLKIDIESISNTKHMQSGKQRIYQGMINSIKARRKKTGENVLNIDKQNSDIFTSEIDLSNNKESSSSKEESSSSKGESSSSIKNSKPSFYIYAHNLGRYDGIFIVRSFLQCGMDKIWGLKPKMVFKNNTLVKLSLGPNISFLDSMQIMNASLNSIAKTMLQKEKISLKQNMFTIPLLKQWIDDKHKWVDFKTYLARDCSLLIDIIHILAEMFFNSYGFILGEKSTISSTATEIYFRRYYSENKNLSLKTFSEYILHGEKIFHDKNKFLYIYSLTSIQDSFIRKAFIGGRTEVFENFAEGVYIYDINSAYCAAMVDCDMPTGKPQGPFKVNNPIEFYLYEIDYFFGFMEATVISPPHIDPPVLPYKDTDGSIIYPRGRFRGYFFSEEIKLAKKYGYIIIVHETITFKRNKKLFSNFIIDTYSQRLMYPKNTPENMFYKIIMLSVFGRFALNPESSSYNICFSEKELYKDMDKPSFQSFESFKTLNGDIQYIVRHHSKNDLNISSKKGSPFIDSRTAHYMRIAPQISAAITSYVRIMMYDVLREKNNLGLLYSDTDSVFMKKPLKPDKISSTELGKWKFEGFYDYGIFIAKKLYKLFLIKNKSDNDKSDLENVKNLQILKNEFKANAENNNLTSNKMGAKGIPPDYLNELLDGDWLDLLKTHPITKVIEGSIDKNKVKMFKSYQSASVQISPTNLTISNLTLDKSRAKVNDIYGNTVTTIPYLYYQKSKTKDKHNEDLYENYYENLHKSLLTTYPWFNFSQPKKSARFSLSQNAYYTQKRKLLKQKLKIKCFDKFYTSGKQPITSLFSHWEYNSDKERYIHKNDENLDLVYKITLEKIKIFIVLDMYESIKPLPTRYLKHIKTRIYNLYIESLIDSNLEVSEFIESLYT